MVRNLPRLRLVAACALILVGCVSSQNTRLPTVRAGRPDVERRSYEYHDPSADNDFGPHVDRPPWFEQQRTVPRRTIERAGNPAGAGSQSGLGPSAAKYPNSVAQ
ncbi:MAG: hypothetical protein EHM42_05455 [Planctomycetaceae bacterium]|nr:MAG: hypothetical protein EHM42_05455 [Planctomycetaceae bacterium]